MKVSIEVTDDDREQIGRVWGVKRATREQVRMFAQAAISGEIEAMPDDSAREPWCPDHGYGCEPQNCPCGHSLRCDCVSIQNDH